MGRPARAGALPGLGAVGTPRNGRGVETMETTMANRIRQPKKTETPATAKAKTIAGRGRRGPKTKKEIAIALLDRPKAPALQRCSAPWAGGNTAREAFLPPQ